MPTALRFILTTTLILGCSPISNAAPPPLEPLHVEGRDLVTPAGDVVVLRGVNLGNWLLIEPWMLGLPQNEEPGGFPDQHTVLQTLEDRFGPVRAEALMEIYREHWVTARDFEIMASFGFNAVRLPIHYSVLEAAEQPGTLREDAFKWIDRAVTWAAEAGLYTILDLHGVPGGQSVDAPSGRVHENRVWTDPEAQRRTLFLWEQLAARYADHPAVAAYDVVNEPYGDFKTDISPVMKNLFGRLHDVIRAVDPDTLIYAPATLQGGITFYGDPASHGWTHVGFTEHTYPGLFGSGEASLTGHARFLDQWVEDKAEYLDRLDVPYLIGEFNVVFDHVGGPAMMRTFFDTFERHGWAATMWSYKITKPRPGIENSNWYLATNDVPFDLGELRTMDDQTLEAKFRSLSTMPLAVDTDLRSALRADPAWPDYRPAHRVAREIPDESIAGWEATDVGGATPGGLRAGADGRWSIWGGGRDVFGTRDDFRFVSQQASGADGLWTRLDAMDATDQFAKAGVMWRESLDPDAAHLLLHALPDGRVVFAHRDQAGGSTAEETLAVSGFPVGLGMTREADELSLHFTDGSGQWQSVTRPDPGFVDGRIGLAVLAHDDKALSRALVAAPGHTAPPVKPQATDAAAAENLLQNASFEMVKDPQNAADQAAAWNRWGQWLNRQEDWSPVRDGDAILAYHHWQIPSADNSGVWQDVEGLTVGQEYRLEVYANLDAGQAVGRSPASVELRLELLKPDGQTLTLATQTYKAADLATGQAWSRLHLTAPATGPKLRVLLVVNPAEDGPREGALKFDDLSLVPVNPEPQ